MKTFILASVTAIIIGSVGMPTATNAAQHVPSPVPSIGISEEAYQALRHSDCEITEVPCGGLVEGLAGHVVMRAEAAGQLYWVNDKDGLPNLNAYLPDGFYKLAGEKKYVLVVDGKRIRIKQGNAFRQLKQAANHGYVTGVSQTDFELMMMSCEHHPDINPDSAQYDECVAEYHRGRQIHTLLAGRFIRIVETGDLYYVEGDDGVTLLQKKVASKSFFSFAKTNATVLPAYQIRAVVKLSPFL